MLAAHAVRGVRRERATASPYGEGSQFTGLQYLRAVSVNVFQGAD